jgi:hypothetical protein
MTRWLAAAKLTHTLGTKPTLPTEPTLGMSDGGATQPNPEVLSVLGVLSGGYISKTEVPPTDPVEPPLDGEGLPCAACPACGGGLFWKDPALTPEGPGWRCEACHPPPPDLWRHACAVPV